MYKTATCSGTSLMLGNLLRMSVKTLLSGCEFTARLWLRRDDIEGYAGPTRVAADAPDCAARRRSASKPLRMPSRVHVGSMLTGSRFHRGSSPDVGTRSRLLASVDDGLEAFR